MERVRPVVSLSALDELLVSEYRLKTVEICELNSHEDRNFHVVCRKLEHGEEITGGNPSLCLNVECCKFSVQNDLENGLTLSKHSDSTCYDYGFLAEKPCKSLVWAESEMRSENPGVSKQSLANDKCANWSCNTNVSSSEDDTSAKFEGLLKITIDESWNTVYLDDCTKISKTERMELQMEIASHLTNCGFVCPEAVMSASTDSLVQRLTMNCDGESVKYLAYLTKYICGSTLNNLLPLSREMMFEVGNLLAQLHHSLKEINIAHEKLYSASPWSLENADMIKDFFSEAELDVAEEELASNVLDHFSQNVLPQLSKLPHGVIHGDFHDENILLVKKDQIKTHSVEMDNFDVDHFILTDPDSIRAKYAVIDFGDVSHSPLMFDLAIAASYFMMCDPRPDFLRNVAHFLCGYFTSYKPTVLELRLLFSSICAAYCRETVLCKYTYLEQDRSNDYILTAVDAGWRQLKELWTMGQDDVWSVWSDACKKYELHLEF